MEENTEPEANIAELPAESIEASKIEKLIHAEDAFASDSSEHKNLTFGDVQMETVSITGTYTSEEDEKRTTREHDSIETGLNPTIIEQKREEYKHAEMATQSEVKDHSHGAEVQIDKTEVPFLEIVPEHENNTLKRKSTLMYVIPPRIEKEYDFNADPPKIEDEKFYTMPPRIEDEYDDEPRTSGDFYVFGPVADLPVTFYKYMDDEGEEEEIQEKEAETEVKSIHIDRQVYYEKHVMLTQLLNNERLENNLLQKKLSIYFKRRRLLAVLKENDEKVETQLRYYKKLDAYTELLEIDSRKRKTVSDELENLREAWENKYSQLQTQFIEFQEREKQVGTGLIYFKTGNLLPDKVVDKLIRLQKSEMEKVIDMRLKFIKLKYLVAEKQKAIDDIDKVTEDLHLMDFERLKVKNRCLAEKIEERDEELTKFRNKCQYTVQVLAHLREKTAALESDLDDLKEDLEVTNEHSIQVRERLNTIKQEREYYRKLSNKLHSESGLLTEDELLKDMEDSMGDFQILSYDLENLKAETRTKTKQIRNIRKHIEYSMVTVPSRTFKILPAKSSNALLHKGRRPSILPPTLPIDAFKDLRSIKSKSTFGKNKTRFILHNITNRFH